MVIRYINTLYLFYSITNILECNKLNLLPKDSFENSTTNENIYNSSLKRLKTPQIDKMSSFKESIKSPNKDDKKSIQSLEKRHTDKKISTNTYITNNYTSVNSNNNTIEHPNLLKKCICYTNYCTENIIKNKTCTICNRYVDKINSYENSIKKKYQQELSRHRYFIKNINIITIAYLTLTATTAIYTTRIYYLKEMIHSLRLQKEMKPCKI